MYIQDGNCIFISISSFSSLEVLTSWQQIKLSSFSIGECTKICQGELLRINQYIKARNYDDEGTNRKEKTRRSISVNDLRSELPHELSLYSRFRPVISADRVKSQFRDISDSTGRLYWCSVTWPIFISIVLQHQSDLISLRLRFKPNLIGSVSDQARLNRLWHL